MTDDHIISPEWKFARHRCPVCGRRVSWVEEKLSVDTILAPVKGKKKTYRSTGKGVVNWGTRLPTEDEEERVLVGCKKGHLWTTKYTYVFP